MDQPSIPQFPNGPLPTARELTITDDNFLVECLVSQMDQLGRCMLSIENSSKDTLADLIIVSSIMKNAQHSLAVSDTNARLKPGYAVSSAYLIVSKHYHEYALSLNNMVDLVIRLA